MRKLIIIGAGEPGQEIANILQNGAGQEDLKFYYFYDDFVKREGVLNSVTEDLRGLYFTSSIGNVSVRESLFRRFVLNGLVPATIISNSAWISPDAKIADGVVVYPFSNISAYAEVRENVLINFQVSISHGVQIGANSNLCPGARIAGNVTLGKNVYIGIGSVIKEKLTICDNVLIGANSTVLRDITEPGVYVGSPCRLLKTHPI